MDRCWGRSRREPRRPGLAMHWMQGADPRERALVKLVTPGGVSWLLRATASCAWWGGAVWPAQLHGNQLLPSRCLASHGSHGQGGSRRSAPGEQLTLRSRTPSSRTGDHRMHQPSASSRGNVSLQQLWTLRVPRAELC